MLILYFKTIFSACFLRIYMQALIPPLQCYKLVMFYCSFSQCESYVLKCPPKVAEIIPEQVYLNSCYDMGIGTALCQWDEMQVSIFKTYNKKNVKASIYKYESHNENYFRYSFIITNHSMRSLKVYHNFPLPRNIEQMASQKGILWENSF